MSMAIKQGRANTLTRSPYVAPGMTSMRATTARAGMAGDPGLFGFIGDALKTVGSAVGIIPGVGSIAGTALGTVGGLLSPQESTGGFVPASPSQQAPPLPGLGGTIARILPGGSSGYGYTEQQLNNWKRRAGKPAPMQGVGMIWNKADYWLKDGTFVPAGSKAVKRRRRNVANMRALDRALGRLDSAKRLQHKLGGYSTRKFTATGAPKKSCR